MTSTSTSTEHSTENFADLFQETLIDSDIRPGMTVSGSIVRIDNNRITVNAGLKSDALIPAEEFNGEEIAVGDIIRIVIDSLEDGLGNTRASREKARRNEVWDVLEEIFNKNETVTGLVTERVKGGFTVDLKNIRAFLPGSLVEARPGKEPVALEGKEMEFKIIKIDQKRNNVVLSRRAVLENEVSHEQREQLLESLREGQEITGIVKNITDYGAFVDLGGLDGLLHITDMSWRRVKHPGEVLKVGATVTVRVLKYDREKKRVSLGLKQLNADPWKDIARRYPQKTRLFGHVTNIMDYGVFVQIEEGIEGLVHVSEIDWTNKNVHPSKLLKLNDEVEVVVLEIDEPRRRISLGMKQCLPNPWEEFAKTYHKNDKVTGQIKSITDFGLFIGLDGNIDGLIHSSDLSWTDNGEELLQNYKKGDEVTAIILSIDPERERISLGIKQMAEDPFADFLEQNPKGTKLSAQVKSVDDKNIIVSLASGLEGTARVSDDTSAVKEGDSVEVYMLGSDRKAGSFNVSFKPVDAKEAKTKDPQAAAKNKKTSPQETISNTTLGDLLREKIDK